MITLEEALTEKETSSQDRFKCTSCKRAFPAFAVHVDDSEAVTVSRRTVHRVKEEQPFLDPADAGKPYEPEYEDVEEIEIEAPVLTCGECIIDAQRELNFKNENAEKARIEREEPWNTDLANGIKAERNARIERVRWAVDPLTSPLSHASQQKFAQYIKKLHRITIDFPTPKGVEWPIEPEPEFPPPPK